MKLIRILQLAKILNDLKRKLVKELEDTEIYIKSFFELFQFLKLQKITIHPKIALKLFSA